MDRNSTAETAKSIRKCCISRETDGTDGDMLWNGSGEGGNIRGECEKDEDTDRSEGDSDTDW